MNPRCILLSLSLAIVVMLQLGASCASSGPYDQSSDRSYPEVEHPRRIPRSADMVREGRDKLKWTADLNGDIYVYDAQDDRIVYTGPIRRNQELVIVPSDDRVYVEGRVVSNENLRRDAHHQVYFVREAPRDDRPGRTPPEDMIPRDARRLARGTGDLAIDQCPAKGTLIVFDEDDRTVVYTTQIDRGASFQIFPRSNYVNINSKRAANVRFTRGHEYSLHVSSNR